MTLYPGRAWKLFAGERHRFETREDSLDVLVFHPDSEDDAHQLPDATIIRAAHGAPRQGRPIL